jgi:hypothetical protein
LGILVRRGDEFSSVAVDRAWRLVLQGLSICVCVEVHIVERALDVLCRDNLLARFERGQKDISASWDAGNVEC